MDLNMEKENDISTLDINELLSYIQAHIDVPKSQYNSFGKYNYRSQEDILTALKPFLLASKASVVLQDKIELIGDRYYVKAIAILRKGTEFVDSVAYAREPLDKKGMDSAQITGSTSSYARKYALNGLFGIDDVKDADVDKSPVVTNTQPKAEIFPELKLNTENYMKVMKAIIEGKAVPLDAKKKYKVSKEVMSSLEELVK